MGSRSRRRRLLSPPCSTTPGTPTDTRDTRDTPWSTPLPAPRLFSVPLWLTTATTTARGRLRPSLRLRPMPTTATTDTVWAMPDTATATDTDAVWATPDTEATDTVWDTEATTARGPLTPSPPLLLSPRLMPMLTTATT